MKHSERHQYSITKELSGELYADLLNYSLKICDRFLLIERHFGESTDVKTAIDMLERFLLTKESTNKWPGTELLGTDNYAVIRYYSLNTDSIHVLLSLSKRLYGWVYPDKLEDLTLVRRDDSPWLVTIAHEEDAYFEMTDDEMKSLCSNISGIRDFINITM